MYVPQHIPQCFLDKITLDKRYDKIKGHEVVSFSLFKRIKLLRDTARYRCEFVIKSSRDPRGGAIA